VLPDYWSFKVDFPSTYFEAMKGNELYVEGVSPVTGTNIAYTVDSGNTYAAFKNLAAITGTTTIKVRNLRCPIKSGSATGTKEITVTVFSNTFTNTGTDA
jgi:hypothetical protein